MWGLHYRLWHSSKVREKLAYRVLISTLWKVKIGRTCDIGQVKMRNEAQFFRSLRESACYFSLISPSACPFFHLSACISAAPWNLILGTLSETLSRHESALFGWNGVRQLVRPPLRLSIYPSVPMYQGCSHWTGLREIWCWRLLWKSVDRFQVWLQSHKNAGNFTLRRVIIADDLNRYKICPFE
jgi:hypothetical protein